jgi:hypothetical protein
MWSRFLFGTLVLVMTSVFGGSNKSLSAQMNMGMSSDELPQSFQEPMKLFEKGLGPLTRTVTTDVRFYT